MTSIVCYYAGVGRRSARRWTLTRLLPNFNSIGTRIIIFGIVLLALSTAARILLLDRYLRDDIVETNSQQLLALANYAARDIDRNVVERRDLLKRMAARFPLSYLNDPAKLRAWLAERHEIHPVFSRGFRVLDAAGRVVASYPYEEEPGASYADRDYFRKALGGGFAIGRPFRGAISKVPLLPMAVPLTDARGKVRGVLTGASALDLPNFLDPLQKTRIGKEGGLVLVSPKDELIVGDSRGLRTLAPTPKKGMHRQHDMAMQGYRGVGIDGNKHGPKELAAVVSVPSSGWFLVARVPTSEVFAPLASLHRFMVGNFLLLSAIFLVVMVAGLRYLLEPLRFAAEHADRMVRKEIPLQPLPVVRDDEVAHLTRAYNRVLLKLMESRGRLEHLANHDTLTGLPNRKLLADRLKLVLARARQNGSLVAVLLLDLDGFKPINDELGHAAGDEALCLVAGRLEELSRSVDTMARLGGDEFVILLTDQQGEVRLAAEWLAGKCLESMREPLKIKGTQRMIGTSIGVAIGGGQSCPDELLSAADHAMYRAKQHGGGAVRWAQ